MKCPKCQFENPEGMKFCGGCGAKIERICENCGFANPANFKFCGECGRDLIASPKPALKQVSLDDKIEKIQRYLPEGLINKIISQKDKIEGERKQVTVMFCDMVGFTPLVEQVGAEEAYSIMDQVYELLIHKVHDYEGTVNEMTGDGIMALFGAPIALEDAAQRAIRSAYAIHREIAKFSDKIRKEKEGIPSLKMRIGIHTGPVVVGTLGNNLRVEFKAVGDTVNLASRIEGLADAGTTYVSDETFKNTEGLFRFEALGQVDIKGKKAPVHIYRVIAPSTRKTRFDVSAERGLTPFVGREREIELMLDGFERSKSGRGQAFSIMAEAGVGKSRFLYEFRKAISNEDVTFLEGKCLSYSRGVAYYPVIDVLKSNFDIRDEDGGVDITEKIMTGLSLLGADEASTLPYLLELFSVKLPEADQVIMTPEEKTVRIAEAVKSIVIKGSEIRPLVIAIEDLHWIDKSSEDFFRNLLDGISGARVFLIFTFRPEFVHTWGGKSFHSQVNLNRFSNRESLKMMATLLGTDDISRDLETLILEKTEGVPFYIEQFIKSLKALGVIEMTSGKCGIKKDAKEIVIPSTIQDVIMARMDALPEEAKYILQAGSVVGREFSHELIQKIVELQEPDLLSQLSVLKDAELIYERGIYPQSTYIFKHAFTQDVAYESLLLQRRRVLHGKVGQALENVQPDGAEEQSNLLCHHFSMAENWEKAVVYAPQAARRAYRLSQFQEAVTLLEQAQSWLLKLSEDRSRQQTLIELRLEMNWPLQNLGELDRALKNCREAERLARSLQSQLHLGKTFYQYAQNLFFKNQYEEAEAYFLRALKELEGTEEDQLILYVKFWLAVSYFSQAKWENAEALYTENIRIQERDQSQSKYLEEQPYLPYSHSCTHLSYILAIQGRIEAAKDLLQKGHAPGVERVANLQSKAWCSLWHSIFSALIGEDFGALARIEPVLKIAEETGSPILCFLCFAAKGNALMAKAEFEYARMVYQKALDAVKGTTYRRLSETVYYNLVQVNLLLGDWSEADRHYEAGLPLVQFSPRKDAPRYDFLKGRLLEGGQSPDLKEAETYYHKSISADEEAGAVVMAAQTRFYLAQLYSKKGELALGRSLLSDIKTQFQKWGIPVWQRKTETALASLSPTKQT